MTVDRPPRPYDEELRERRWPPGGGKPIDTAMVAGDAFALRYIGDAVVYLADIISSTSGPGLRDGIRERPSTWPSDSGDTVESRNLPAAPPEVGDDPAGSDGSTATRGPAVGTGESTGPTSFVFLWEYGIGERFRTIGLGPVTHVAVPFDEWRAWRDESEAHAPDLPEPETELAGHITYRSTVVQSRAEGPDQVLAMVQFTEGVSGRVHALERFTASLRQTSQDAQP